MLRKLVIVVLVGWTSVALADGDKLVLELALRGPNQPPIDGPPVGSWMLTCYEDAGRAAKYCDLAQVMDAASDESLRLSNLRLRVRQGGATEFWVGDPYERHPYSTQQVRFGSTEAVEVPATRAFTLDSALAGHFKEGLTVTSVWFSWPDKTPQPETLSLVGSRNSLTLAEKFLADEPLNLPPRTLQRWYHAVGKRLGVALRNQLASLEGEDVSLRCEPTNTTEEIVARFYDESLMPLASEALQSGFDSAVATSQGLSPDACVESREQLGARLPVFPAMLTEPNPPEQ